ncbi:uncharacterized [Tachysurus ichikawai]
MEKNGLTTDFLFRANRQQPPPHPDSNTDPELKVMGSSLSLSTSTQELGENQQHNYAQQPTEAAKQLGEKDREYKNMLKC